MSFVLDTNIVIYWLNGRLITDLPRERLIVSVITEMESLSFQAIKASDEEAIQSALELMEIVPLTEAVKLRAIALRRTHRLKLADAIIAGTTLALGAELISNDSTLAKVPGLKCRRMALKPLP